MSTTQKDIARLLGMAQSTVSMALNGHPRISDDTRDRVLTAAKRAGYHPNFGALYLTSKKTNMISVLIHDVTLIELHSKWLAHLQEAAHGRGLKFRLDSASDYDIIAGEHSADGFIIFGEPRHLGELLRERMGMVRRPIVFTDCSSFDVHGHHRVSIDNALGGRLAVGHLAGLGHRRIAFLGLYGDSGVCCDRYWGYKEGMMENGLGIRPCDVIEYASWEDDPNSFHPYAPALMEAIGQGVTAIVASRDIDGIFAVKVLGKAGFSVPGDISIVAFDQTKLSELWDPALTVIRQDIGSASAIAVDMLLELINGGDPPLRVVSGVDLVIRESSGIIKGEGSPRDDR